MSFHLPVLNASARLHTERIRIASDFEHDLQEAMVEMGSTLSCRKGCNSCCHYPISISVLEGLRLFEALDKAGKWTSALRAKCETLSKRLVATRPEVWLLSMTPCPLLQDGSCMAYAERPLQCRTLFSSEDPSFCHPHSLSGSNGPFPRTDPLAEFAAVEETAFKSLGVRKILVPIATALLIAERVAASNIDLNDVQNEIVLAYTEALQP